MANSYVAPNFNIDTSTNVAGLTALKGGAPAAADYIYVYNSAVLTVEQNLACTLISLGETSAGAATDGQRRGDVTFEANITVTFTGTATYSNSGVKCNPASAPGTALESKGSTIIINGTSAQPTVFTNSAGACADANEYSIYMTYGVFGAMGSLTMQYASYASGSSGISFPMSSTYTTSASHTMPSVYWTPGAPGNVTIYCFRYNSANAGDVSMPVVIPAGTLDLNTVGNSNAAFILFYAPATAATASSTTQNIEIQGYTIMGDAVNNALVYPYVWRNEHATTTYMSGFKQGTTNWVPTLPTFAGLTGCTARADGNIELTWDAAADHHHYRVYARVGSAPTASDDYLCGSSRASATGAIVSVTQDVTANGQFIQKDATIHFLVQAANSVGDLDGNAVTLSAKSVGVGNLSVNFMPVVVVGG